MTIVIKQIIINLALNQSVQEDGCFGINVMHQVALQASKSRQKDVSPPFWSTSPVIVDAFFKHWCQLHCITYHHSNTNGERYIH